jgi:hypothetical protein
VQNMQKLNRGLISKKHRGFFTKFPKILITELFSNGKGEPHQRQEGAAEGQTQPSDGGEKSAEVTLGEGELRTRKHAIEGEVSVVMAGGCSSSFYSGRGRAHRGGGGRNGQR